MAALEQFNLPPPVIPASPLDNAHDRRALPPLDSRIESYASTSLQNQSRDQSQTQLHQPLIQSQSPFGDNAETASVAHSIATTRPPSIANTASRQPAHRNEEEYLAALRAWAEEKQYVQLDRNGGLPGFYGSEELKERAERMKKERKEEKDMKLRRKMARRGTMASPEDEGHNASDGVRRRGGVAHFFRRQSNAV